MENHIALLCEITEELSRNASYLKGQIQELSRYFSKHSANPVYIPYQDFMLRSLESSAEFDHEIDALRSIIKSQVLVNLNLASNPNLTIPITSLGISRRVQNLLMSLNIESVGDIYKYSYEQLRFMGGFGRVTELELQIALTELGLPFPPRKGT